MGRMPLPQGRGRTINCTVTPLLRSLGRRGSPAGLAPTASPEPSRVGLPPQPGHSRASGAETGLGGGRGVVTAAGTRGWGQDGVSSPRHPPTPQDERPGVCSQISPAWVPRAHPTGTPPPLPTARPVLRSFDAPGKGGRCHEAPQPRADLKRLVAWTLRETQEIPSNNPGSHRPRAPGEGPGAWRRRHRHSAPRKGGPSRMGVKDGEPSVCSARGGRRQTRLSNSSQQGRTGRKAPRHTLTQAFTSTCAGTRVRDAALRGWTERGQGRAAPPRSRVFPASPQPPRDLSP